MSFYCSRHFLLLRFIELKNSADSLFIIPLPTRSGRNFLFELRLVAWQRNSLTLHIHLSYE